MLALPYFEGERAPRWNRELRAELTGIDSTAGPGEIARALLEGTAYGLAHIAAELASQGVSVERVVCGGTPSTSRLWCSIKADVLDVPVEVPDYPELAAYGAALAAGAAVDWWPRPGSGRQGAWPHLPTSTIDPQPRPEYRLGLERFIALGDEAVRRLGVRATADSGRSPDKTTAVGWRGLGGAEGAKSGKACLLDAQKEARSAEPLNPQRRVGGLAV